MKATPLPDNQPVEGILLLDKAKGRTSFSLVHVLRKRLGVKKIGHAGTLDPFATGVMVLLVGRNFTRLSDQFLCNDKEYEAEVYLGSATDTYDCEGKITFESSSVPSLDDILKALERFQGEVDQIPPMFSAKKKQGKKLYELARKGLEIERDAVRIRLETHFVSYKYPKLHLRIACSKGTYIRSIADDLGKLLGCGAHLTNLKRTRSGKFTLDGCLTEEELTSPSVELKTFLRRLDC